MTSIDPLNPIPSTPVKNLFSKGNRLPKKDTNVLFTY